MIPHGVEVFVGLEPIDLRWGFDRLSGIVAERLTQDARCGALFVFFGKRRDALKVLFFDGTGLCMFTSGWTAARSACRWRPMARRRCSSRSACSMTCSTASISTPPRNSPDVA